MCLSITKGRRLTSYGASNPQPYAAGDSRQKKYPTKKQMIDTTIYHNKILEKSRRWRDGGGIQSPRHQAGSLRSSQVPATRKTEDNMKCQILLLILIVGTLTRCSSSPGEPINHPPQIVSLTATPSTIVAPDISGLDVVATDRDGDELTYTWSAEHGEIKTSPNPAMAIWFSGNVGAGDYRVTCSVSDRQDTTHESVSVTVLAGIGN